MKLGQWMSTRRDIFGSLCDGRLKFLQGEGVRHEWKWTKQILDDEFKGGFYLDENSEIIGSGCVAQVYKCNSGSNSVAVKILHPGIKSSIILDLDILESLANIFDSLPERTGVKWFAVGEAVEEFKGIMEGQIDMNCECSNLIR